MEDEKRRRGMLYNIKQDIADSYRPIGRRVALALAAFYSTIGYSSSRRPYYVISSLFCRVSSSTRLADELAAKQTTLSDRHKELNQVVGALGESRGS